MAAATSLSGEVHTPAGARVGLMADAPRCSKETAPLAMRASVEHLHTLSENGACAAATH